ncbi:unnamed protein product (macronuclear) [Paramecium tetraurelia]|uniref:Response regulatory domain-containing protein n=1 Tax=Paramecium tetraurelia TaxID=5888 RepID=A0D8B2_PARTE|nr:uncharacterized protein GSPATT00014246001 [Paramecium tetraurelia]CAK79279.1 unnamed protein product [Paramecium tetraurelia]|eukprot:XP_001446676.1 hypothetical protein (macronuclear) [Paramecium tetraurelia strain d4-2]
MNKKPQTKDTFLQTNLFLLATQIVLNISLIQELTEIMTSLIVIILKVIFDIFIFCLLYLLQNKITPNIILKVRFADRILEILAIAIIQLPSCIFLSIQMCYPLEIKADQCLAKITLIANILGKLTLILSVSLVQINAISFVCSFVLIGIDILKFTQSKGKTQNKNQYLQSQLNELQSPSNYSKKSDNIWRQRIQDMNVQVLILDYSNLCVKYINQCFLKLFKCSVEDELQKIILSQLNFQIPQQCTEDFKSASLQIKRLRDKQRDLSCREFKNLESTKQVIKIQTKTLEQIINEYKQGYYDSLIQASSNKAFDISCTLKLQNSNPISLSGQIISDNEEITIFLNDISKQTELSQQKIKDDFKSKIIESFSHEMKTPLNSAKNLIESTLSDSTVDNYIKNQYLQPAFNSLKLQSYIINDIIDFSNYYANSFYLQTRDFTFKELINEISGLFQQQFEMKNMGLVIVMKKNHFSTFNTDYNRLIQIIVNLLANSLKFSYGGNVFVNFKSMDQNTLKISIKDEGIGIEQEKLERIQRTLYQFQETSDFVFNQGWHGFGLLISSILLTKLCANTNKQLLSIKSKGKNLGTKVTIFVDDQNRGQCMLASRKSDIIGAKIHSQNKIQIGTVIVTSVKKMSNHKNNDIIFPQLKTKELFTDIIDQSSEFLTLNSKVKELQASDPKLISYLNDSPSSDQSPDINYRQLGQSYDYPSIQHQFKDQKSCKSSKSQLKQLEDKESEFNLLNFVQKKKCHCRRILSVDDEVFNQHSLCMLLQKLDFEVLVAFNGQQAIDMIGQLQKCCDHCQLLDLILMDYQMPILNGIETTKLILEMIKAQKIPLIKIIGLTAFTAESDVINCLDAGMTYVLSKPLNLKEFKELLPNL